MMNLKKKAVSMVATTLLTMGCVSGSLAAGIGVVDFGYAERQHPQFQQAVTSYQSSIQQYRTEFTQKSKNLNDTQKQQMISDFNAKLNQQRVALFQPIDKDVLNAINKVRAAKGLDYIAVKGYVLSSTTAIVDITNDVVQQVKGK
jgi:outer membrane protein